MIDCENEVYTRVAQVLREKFPGIDVASEYVQSPSSFPHASITQSDSYTLNERQDTSMKENMIEVMFEINVYSNRTDGKKTECKNILKVINDELYSMNFRRRVATDGKHFYRR